MIVKSLLIFGCCFLLACSSAEEPKEPTISSSHETQEENSLTLNEGQKWKMPEDMMWLIQQQKDKVFEYTMANDTTYIVLGTELDSLCQRLVQVCSMTGEGHNNLHLWLIPYWEKIDSINTSLDHVGANHYINQLNDDFLEFDNYFE